MHSVKSKTAAFDGWLVVAAAFIVTFIGFGSAYTFSSFIAPLQQEFGASRGSVSLVFSLAAFLYFSLGTVSGPLADRFGARPLVAGGMGLVGLGLILASQAQSFVQVYAAYSIGVGVGVGGAYVPTLGAVQRRFVKCRGFASGLAVSGIGVGTLVMPLLATWLIAIFGWRTAYLVLGGLAVAIGCSVALFIIDDPGQRSPARDGLPFQSVPAVHGGRGLSIAEAVRTPRFVGLYAACLISAFGVFVPFVHLVPYAVDRGVSLGSAVALLSMIGIGSTVGRFFLSGIADRMGRDAFLVGMYLGMSASLAMWAIAGEFWSLTSFALLFGIFYGGWVAILPALVTDHFGGRHVSGIIGVLYTSIGFGTLLGPSTAGYFFDLSHSYFLPIVASALANMAAVAIAVATNKSRSPMNTVQT
ncbi:MFS transporter [Mesorhizobium sp. CO1-1-11]|uniref:MFS transporter n=1 Tax=Mesorhizobium sp. CO1-1-11 TaxID=2876636 RepID=UPI001CCC74AF|nr:MFS transporter [Mesorhizobium sp. CO1-1-11]MBZ9726322.1 MFS transporter [Mesorhizobium sp. CO1-1-11]